MELNLGPYITPDVKNWVLKRLNMIIDLELKYQYNCGFDIDADYNGNGNGIGFEYQYPFASTNGLGSGWLNREGTGYGNGIENRYRRGDGITSPFND